jgi:hypothetical protein
MTDTAAESLRHLVATSLERVKELRRAGDPAVLLAAANAAADESAGSSVSAETCLSVRKPPSEPLPRCPAPF